MKKEDIMFAIFAIIAIIILLWYIFGNSPTIEQLLIALVGANLGFSFKISADLNRHLGEHSGYLKTKYMK